MNHCPVVKHAIGGTARSMSMSMSMPGRRVAGPFWAQAVNDCDFEPARLPAAHLGAGETSETNIEE